MIPWTGKSSSNQKEKKSRQAETAAEYKKLEHKPGIGIVNLGVSRTA